jgi:DNA-binding response OmpR family regulator
MPSTAQLLVVSPDRAARQVAERCLAQQGLTVHLARNLTEAQRILARTHIDLICIDSLIKSEHAERLARWLGAGGRPGPRLVFLAPPAAARLGSLPGFFDHERDGLVPKPIVSDQLVTAVARQLAAADRQHQREILQVGHVTLDCTTRRLLFANGGSLSPTPTEFRLLKALMERPGEFVSPNELLESVWGYTPDASGPELVRAHVSNLRRKLRSMGKDPHLVRTVPYRGYSFEPSDARRAG